MARRRAQGSSQSARCEHQRNRGSHEGLAQNSGQVQEKHEKSGPRLYIFIIITAVIALPRVLMLGYYHVHLSSGWLRRPVGLAQERPLLVVGTMASGTKQMSSELGKLGLEVAHENSDTTSSFSRDGTISWVHGLRFMDGQPRPESIATLCREPRFNAFHPTMFRPSSKCSYFSLWSDCWARECATLWRKEYGCHHRGDQQAGNFTACVSPFTTQLLQVRHPLRTISSLVAKSEPECGNARHQLAVVAAMFPSFNWRGLKSCAETWGWYWVLYHNAILPHVDDWYAVENTPPCKVAEMAGLLYGAAAEVCASRREGEGPGHGERHGYMNQKNKARMVLSWEDMEQYPNNLAAELRRLAGHFGYDN